MNNASAKFIEVEQAPERITMQNALLNQIDEEDEDVESEEIKTDQSFKEIEEKAEEDNENDGDGEGD